MATRLARGVATTEKAPFKAQAQGINPLSRGRRLNPRGKKKPRGTEAKPAQVPRKRHFRKSGQDNNPPSTQSRKPKVRRNQRASAIPAGRKTSRGFKRKLPESQLPKPEKTSIAESTKEKEMVRSPRK